MWENLENIVDDVCGGNKMGVYCSGKEIHSLIRILPVYMTALKPSDNMRLTIDRFIMPLRKQWR